MMKPCSRQLCLRRIIASALFALASILQSFAHDPGLSTVNLRLRPAGIDIALSLSVKDAGALLNLDKSHDGLAAMLQGPAGEAALAARAEGALELRINDQPASLATARCSLADNNANVHFQVAGQPEGTLQFRSRWLALLPPGHRQFLTVQDQNGRVLLERLLSANSDSAVLELPRTDAIAPEHSARSSFVSFLGLGLKHILIGYDHLLFLFTLLIVTRSLLATLKIITCFTLAHSITLALATFEFVQIPGRVVEPLIAISIVFVALENLVRVDQPKSRMLLVFAFGLIHGLGFASVLRELGVGTTGTGVVMPLLSFNLGVELGQLLVAVPLVPLLRRLNERPIFVQRWVPACSVVAAMVGTFWLVQRVCFAS